MSVNLDYALKLSGYGPEYYDLPLGTDLDIFHRLCRFLQGHLDSFPQDFIPPGYQNPRYKPIDKGLPLKIFGLTSLSVAVLVVIARLGTQSLRAAGGQIKINNRTGGITGKRNRLGAWEGRTDLEWWKPWKRYGLRFGKLGWDDGAMVIALVFLAGYTTLNSLSVLYGGMGKHVYDITLNQAKFILKMNFIHTVVYLTLAFFIKLSILLFYLKLFPPAFIWMRRTIFCLITLFFVYTVVGTTVTCLMCKPVRAFWTVELRVSDSCPSGKEVQERYISILSFHVVGDFIVVILPIHLISTLRLPKRQKIMLGLLFSAGGLACIASILRLYYFPLVSSSLDITWNAVDVFLWGQVEASTAVICASLPSLKPLFSSLKSLRPNPTTAKGKGLPTGSPHHTPNTEARSRNGSFATPGLPSSQRRLPGVINTAHLSPNRGEGVPFSPTRTSPMSTSPSRNSVRDFNDIVLDEIDSIDVHPGPSIRISPPRRMHKTQSKSKLDDQHNTAPASCSSNVSSLSLSTDSPQYLSVPQQNYLCPGQGQLRPSSLTQSTGSGTTLVQTTPSSKKSSSRKDSYQSSAPESVSISTSQALPTLPAEAHYTPGRPPQEAGWGSSLPTIAMPYVYPQHSVLDTTGVDSYYSVPAGHHESSGTNAEWGGWGGWGYYDRADMV